MKKENLEGRRTMIQKEVATRARTEQNNSSLISHSGGQNKRTTGTYNTIRLDSKIVRFVIRCCYTIKVPKSRDDKGYGGDEYDV